MQFKDVKISDKTTYTLIVFYKIANLILIFVLFKYNLLAIADLCLENNTLYIVSSIYTLLYNVSDNK